ncbi:unnamed protein product [Cyberlindnera jadinii]|uniref:Cell wall protein CWP1 n=1 Tax=Cyberlindnera jadinii (strain ATCC 18201 / CBS 1600 / BCRC 20928 / JCM 3617 / NBRC 0987 / NRRL Y-1542) TaxID=983966 RepID=A0A0H5CB50_CYBJN|nr:unnamed protein product [Cyberlindnera jadinii]
MQYSSIFVSLAMAATAFADSEAFGLVLIRSGASYQNAPVSIMTGKLQADTQTNNYINAKIDDDGKLNLGADGVYAVVQDDGIYSGSDASTVFSIVDGYLLYNGAGFSLDEDYNVLAGTEGPNPVAIRASLSDGSTAADFTPGKEESSSEESSEEPASTTTVAEEETSTSFVVQTAENGVAKVGAGAGAIAIAAAMFF